MKTAPYVVLGALLSGGIAVEARAEDGRASKITLLVYNYAGLPADTLLVAEQEASRIFQHSGVGVTWRPCAVAESPVGTECPPPSPYLPALRVVARFQPASGILHTNTTGYCAGFFATVSMEYAEKLEQSGVRRLPEVLGHVMAHEIGHLFLPGRGHSRDGIMRAQWRLAEFALIRHKALLFAPEQERFLRTKLLYRTDVKTKT